MSVIIGSQLRAAREEKGLSIPEVSAKLRISKRYIQALEDENFLMIPSLVYAKGFLKAYAEFLGLDAKAMVSGLVERYQVKKEELRPAEPKKKPPYKLPYNLPSIRIGINPVHVVYVILVVVFLLLIGFELSSGRKHGEALTENIVTPEAAAVKPAVEPPKKMAVPPAQNSVDNRPGVRIEAVSNVWVQVDSDGQVVYDSQLAKAHWIVFRGKEVRVRTNDAASVRVYLNGRNMGLLGAKGEQADAVYNPFK